MKRFLSVFLACLILCAVCITGASAAAPKAFSPNAIQECIFLVDTDGNFGHCALILADKNGTGRLYSYQTGGLWVSNLTPAQMTQFMKDGLIPDAISNFQFDHAVRFGVSAEEGRRMYDYAETHKFREFFMYSSFFTSLIPIGDNCLTFARTVMAAGSPKYDFIYPFGLPAFTFYTLQLSLRLNSVPYTLYYPG